MRWFDIKGAARRLHLLYQNRTANKRPGSFHGSRLTFSVEPDSNMVVEVR